MRNKITNKAFSLVELLVVIGIITLFAVISLPKYSNISQHAKLSKTKMNLVNIKNGFTNHYYDNLIANGDIDYPPAPTDSLMTQTWANTTILENGKTVAQLFSEGTIIYNPNNNPYVYRILPETEFEHEGFILRDPDFNVEVRFRP